MLKKVCHLTSVHRIDDPRIFTKECTSLSENGFEVTLIACGNTEFAYTLNGVKCISLGVPVKNRLQRFIKRPKILYRKALQIDSDIYHIHDLELLQIGFKLKKKGKKVVYDAHEDYPRQNLQKEWIPTLLKLPISLIFELYENYYVVRLDAVVTVTNYISKRFSRLVNNVVVCANYASFREFGGACEWDKDMDKICYVGEISEIRGIKEVIEASKIAGVSLELIGRFESEHLEQELVKEINVNFRGYLNRDEIKIILAQCFVGIVTLHSAPNMTHSLPVKLFEYMASGLPVIASNFDDWKPIIEDNNAGLCVDPKNIASISDAILYLKNNPQIAKQKGLNGRKAFEEKYNWQMEENKLIDLYKSL